MKIEHLEVTGSTLKQFLTEFCSFLEMYVYLFFFLFVMDPVSGSWGQQYDYWESPDGAIVHCLSSVHLDIQGIS